MWGFYTILFKKQQQQNWGAFFKFRKVVGENKCMAGKAAIHQCLWLQYISLHVCSFWLIGMGASFSLGDPVRPPSSFTQTDAVRTWLMLLTIFMKAKSSNPLIFTIMACILLHKYYTKAIMHHYFTLKNIFLLDLTTQALSRLCWPQICH